MKTAWVFPSHLSPNKCELPIPHSAFRPHRFQAVSCAPAGPAAVNSLTNPIALQALHEEEQVIRAWKSAGQVECDRQNVPQWW